MQTNLPQRSIVIGVMGGANVPALDERRAYQLGKLIAKNGWVLLNGGRNRGIMHASAQGAFEHSGMTVGILPGDDLDHLSKYIQLPIVTGMGSARNYINVLSSQIVIGCNGSAGTLSEIALALKHGKPVILMGIDTAAVFDDYYRNGTLSCAKSPQDAISQIKTILAKQNMPPDHRVI